MTCINADKLAAYVDEIVTQEEKQEIEQHLATCERCRSVVQLFVNEAEFLTETLSQPTLPSTFTQNVLAELEPYKKKRKSYWKRGLGFAAAVTLSLGLTTVISPSFASFVGGLFSTSESLDSGVKEALNAGLVYPVNEEISDAGKSIFIEDILVDSKRIGFTFKVLNRFGYATQSDIEMKNISLNRADGSVIETVGAMWLPIEDKYYYFEVTLSDQVVEDQFSLELDVEQIGLTKGEWHISLPIDLTEAKKLLKTVVIQPEPLVTEQLEFQFTEFKMTPSQNVLTYQVGYSPNYFETLTGELAKLKDKYKDAVSDYLYMELDYEIVDASGRKFFSNKGSGYLIEDNRLTVHENSLDPMDGETNMLLRVKGANVQTIMEDKITIPTNLGNQSLDVKIDGKDFVLKSVTQNKDGLTIKFVAAVKGNQLEISGWALVDAEGKVYQLMYGDHGAPDSIEQYTLTFDVPKKTGDVTLVALMKNQYVPFETPYEFPIIID